MSGSPSWTRTSDKVINSHLLYQLSYRGIILTYENAAYSKGVIRFPALFCIQSEGEPFFSANRLEIKKMGYSEEQPIRCWVNGGVSSREDNESFAQSS